MKTQETVFIVDDDAAVRDSLSLLIGQEDYRVKTFASAAEFLSECEPNQHGCLILDMRMPEMDGSQLQEELRKRGNTIPIVFLTGHGDIPMSVRAIKAGAVDFLTKPVTGDALLNSIHTALKESGRLRAHAESNQTANERLAKLTEREREVMVLAVQGQANKEIARSLGISHRTVEIHKSRIMKKTGMHTLVDLARMAGSTENKAYRAGQE